MPTLRIALFCLVGLPLFGCSGDDDEPAPTPAVALPRGTVRVQVSGAGAALDRSFQYDDRPDDGPGVACFLSGTQLRLQAFTGADDLGDEDFLSAGFVLDGYRGPGTYQGFVGRGAEELLYVGQRESGVERRWDAAKGGSCSITVDASQYSGVATCTAVPDKAGAGVSDLVVTWSCRYTEGL
jgi:hypothetical protein